ncbi:MAG: efflux transporter outer membrane subunit [Hyphomonadaceae bacterium]|nr:efflux transporter outer membrane subunit [Hyphomonadaceae bacterium]
MAIALAASLAACATTPGRRAKAAPLPETWADAPAGATEPASLTAWWTKFSDPMLERLVAEALADGGSVRLAALRVREARALAYSTLSNYLPGVDATASGQYTRPLDGPLLPNADFSGLETEQFIGSFGAKVSWEVPLFGRLHAAAVGARANVRASAADFRGAEVALAADVAQAYVDLRAAQQSRAALRESVELSDRLAEILATSARAGFASEAEAADARRLAESTRTRLPAVEIEARRAERTLAVLRGKAPDADIAEIAAALRADAPVPAISVSASPAAPADLLRLRPDIAYAEAQTLLVAASVGVARSDLLPQININGVVNVSDNVVGNALSERSATVVATPLITLPLFDWGRRIAVVRQRDAQFEQALVQYRETVNRAVFEAAQALTGLDQGARRLQSARRAEEAAAVAARGSRAAYGAGIQSLADRLQSEQQLIDARLTRIAAEQAQAGAAIAVYRAFGGGPDVEGARDRLRGLMRYPEQ